VSSSPLLAGLLALFGLGALFLSPWVGGPLLILAVLVGIGGIVLGGVAASDDADPPERDQPVVAPHLPGPD
jgi:hypothetical protein